MTRKTNKPRTYASVTAPSDHFVVDVSDIPTTFASEEPEMPESNSIYVLQMKEFTEFHIAFLRQYGQDSFVRSFPSFAVLKDKTFILEP